MNSLKFLKFKCLHRKHKRQTKGDKRRKGILNERKEMQREIQGKRGITEARMCVTLRDIVTVAALMNTY